MSVVLCEACGDGGGGGDDDGKSISLENVKGESNVGLKTRRDCIFNYT